MTLYDNDKVRAPAALLSELPALSDGDDAFRAEVIATDGGTIRYYPDLIQGSDEWLAIRRGLITASEMKLILTPTLKIADNDKQRSHLYELLAQRITGYVEPHYISDDMLRGKDDEIEAKQLYHKNYAKVRDVGFITNNRFGFTLGYSPDALVGDEGQVECKSRRQKYQVQTIVEHLAGGEQTIPAEFMLQVQTGLLVSERQWCDFVSYSGGLPMVTVRVFPDPVVQAAILTAATAFEASLAKKLAMYRAAAESGARMISTERKDYGEILV